MLKVRLMAPEPVANEDHLSAPEIETCVERIEARLKTEMPEVTRLFVKPQTSETGPAGSKP
jgi:divalent metal cation (Fe/Co/Zn/Cd) transporter